MLFVIMPVFVLERSYTFVYDEVCLLFGTCTCVLFEGGPGEEGGH